MIYKGCHIQLVWTRNEDKIMIRPAFLGLSRPRTKLLLCACVDLQTPFHIRTNNEIRSNKQVDIFSFSFFGRGEEIDISNGFCGLGPYCRFRHLDQKLLAGLWGERGDHNLVRVQKQWAFIVALLRADWICLFLGVTPNGAGLRFSTYQLVFYICSLYLQACMHFLQGMAERAVTGNGEREWETRWKILCEWQWINALKCETF